MIPFASQVKRFTLINKWSRFFSSNEDPLKVAYPLKRRTLVKVSGPEAVQFLQGLITNDMHHFKEGAKSMYAMFLNTKGRVLYDTLLHKWGNQTENTFMLECDTVIKHLLLKYLKFYRLKKQLKLEDVSELFKIWALIAPHVGKDMWRTDKKNYICIFKDPRLVDLGYRLITTPGVGQVDIHQTVGYNTIIRPDEEEYQALRYRLGVSEGAEDLYPGAYFPLEVNCDYLHGVSFYKGCYIGQELCARVHHRGVIRKRIMPIKIILINQEEELQKGATIWGNFKNMRTNLGKFKGRVGTHGIGLVRIKEALEAETVYIGSNQVQIIKPYWWPVEASKEKFPITPGTTTTT